MRKILLLLMAAVTVGTTLLVVVPAGADAPATHWYICKYVGPPGTFETLQSGQNPIFTDENSIDTFPNVAVGDNFADGQNNSLVVAGPYAPPGIDPEPACPTQTPPPPTSPPPTTAPPTTPPTTTPPPVTTPSCPGKLTTGPWYGDPQINITLTGQGTFVVSGGIQRFSGITKFTRTLACNETFRIGRYKVQRGHFLTVTQDSVVVIHMKPPRFN